MWMVTSKIGTIKTTTMSTTLVAPTESTMDITPTTLIAPTMVVAPTYDICSYEMRAFNHNMAIFNLKIKQMKWADDIHKMVTQLTGRNNNKRTLEVKAKYNTLPLWTATECTFKMTRGLRKGQPCGKVANITMICDGCTYCSLHIKAWDSHPDVINYNRELEVARELDREDDIKAAKEEKEKMKKFIFSSIQTIVTDGHKLIEKLTLTQSTSQLTTAQVEEITKWRQCVTANVNCAQKLQPKID